MYTDTAYIPVYTQCLTSFAVIENPQQLMVPLCSGRLVVVKEQGRIRIGGCPLSDLYHHSTHSRIPKQEAFHHTPFQPLHAPYQHNQSTPEQTETPPQSDHTPRSTSS